ncbi:MAG: class I SAM-dependent methyltransferase, partial [Candidatus Omnitrophica bacterium]|nr:class I SAM-dependent methyltransferase [Candidatus Omnitrophota bacterium]
MGNPATPTTITTTSSHCRKDTAPAYDRLAPQYDVRWARYVRETCDQALRYLDGPNPQRVLDVGCGSGEFLRRLRTRYPAAVLTGVDPSAGMLEVARRKFEHDPQVSVHGAYAERLLFRDESFDGVVCVNALHCVRDAPGALGEMVRVLRPGGRLVVVDW